MAASKILLLCKLPTCMQMWKHSAWQSVTERQRTNQSKASQHNSKQRHSTIENSLCARAEAKNKYKKKRGSVIGASPNTLTPETLLTLCTPFLAPNKSCQPYFLVSLVTACLQSNHVTQNIYNQAYSIFKQSVICCGRWWQNKLPQHY